MYNKGVSDKIAYFRNNNWEDCYESFKCASRKDIKRKQ